MYSPLAFQVAEFLDQHPEEIKTKEPKRRELHQSADAIGYRNSPLAFQVADRKTPAIGPGSD